MSQKITYQKIVSNFEKMIDVNTPIIYINDYDFARVDELIAEVVGGHKKLSGTPQRALPTSNSKRRRPTTRLRSSC